MDPGTSTTGDINSSTVQHGDSTPVPMESSRPTEGAVVAAENRQTQADQNMHDHSPFVFPQSDRAVEPTDALVHPTMEQLQSVFGNDLIFRKLASYLHVSDLKTLKEVCILTRNAMQPACTLQHNVQLTIRQPLEREFLKAAASSEWVNMAFSTDGWRELDDEEMLINLQGILKRVKDLVLFCDHADPGIEITAINRSRNIALEHLISNSPELKNLTLDLSLFTQDLKPVLKEILVQNGLNQVERLNIIRPKMPVPDMEVNLENIYENLDFILATTSLKLKGFRVDALEFSEAKQFGPLDENIYDLMARFIVRSRETLEELALSGDICKMDKLPNITLNSLKNLEIATSVRFGPAQNVVQFIQAQPLLDSLNVKYEHGAPRALLIAIMEKSANLRKLSISCPKFHEPRLPNQLTFQMNFLSTLSRLEEFSFFQTNLTDNFEGEDPPAWVSAALFGDGLSWSTLYARDCVPFLSSGIKKLVLSCVSFDIWEDRGDWLGRFERLTHLNLLGCSDALDDECLQNLCQRGQLIVLEFSHCDNVTEAGVVGLSNLKALRKLTIVCCEFISDDGFVAGIQFKELQSLTLWPTRFEPIPNELLLEIASSNPSLEYLSAMSSGLNCLESASLEMRIKGVCPRFKRMDSEKHWACRSLIVGGDDYLGDEFDFDGSISGGGMPDYDDFDLDDGDEYDIDKDSDFWRRNCSP